MNNVYINTKVPFLFRVVTIKKNVSLIKRISFFKYIPLVQNLLFSNNIEPIVMSLILF